MDGSKDRFDYGLWLFLDPRARELHRDFDAAKHNVVALVHTATARDPYDEGLVNVIGRLYWASHDVFR